MITGKLIHPHLLAAVAGAGHGAHVLILDGHYPASTAVSERAEQVHLNLAPGLLDTSTVLRVLLTAMLECKPRHRTQIVLDLNLCDACRVELIRDIQLYSAHSRTIGEPP